MGKRLRVGILFGGKSAEHEVSLQSARNIVEAIDPQKYELVLIGIGKDGRWFLNEDSHFLLEADNPRLIKLNTGQKSVALLPWQTPEQLLTLSPQSGNQGIDVVFPVLHGPLGEDGTIQGLLKLAGIAFVGPGVLGSAVGMDKDVTKRLLRDANIAIARFEVVTRSSAPAIDFEVLTEKLGLPLFVKPCNMGSSVGVQKVRTRAQLAGAISAALDFDSKVLIEETVVGREIECSVLGNEDPIASLPGEVIPSHDFYSYEAKYVDEKGALLEIPARLTPEVTRRVQQLAVKTFQVLCCEGMTRVDFFVRENGEVLVNEINTIPGFTRISMYPKLWEASGLPYRKLIDRLIELALARQEREKSLRTSYQ